MIYIIISTEELLDFIKNHPIAIIEFKTTWCINCARIAPHYQNFASKYKNMKFANIDVDYVGQDNLDRLNINLNLGAIPSFYLYRNGLFLDRLVSGSSSRLENFIESYYIGDINVDSGLISNSSNYNSSPNNIIISKSFFSSDDDSSEKLPKCSKCSQYGHRSRECYINEEKPQEITKSPSKDEKKDNKVVCSNCSKLHPVWDLKCMNNKNTEKKLNTNNNALVIKEFRKEKQFTSLGVSDMLRTSRSLPKFAITYDNNNVNLSRENSNTKLDEIKPEKKHVTWNLVPIVRETKRQENDLVNVLLEKLSKLEATNKKNENVNLTVKKQKEIISFLKEKVETLTYENNMLKRSKSAELTRETKNK